MATVLIYRPLGDDPPRTKRGDLELGKVHSIAEEKAAPYLKKGFVVMPDDAKTAKPEKLAADYAAAKKSNDDAEFTRMDAEEKAVFQSEPSTTTILFSNEEPFEKWMPNSPERRGKE